MSYFNSILGKYESKYGHAYVEVIRSQVRQQMRIKCKAYLVQHDMCTLKELGEDYAHFNVFISDNFAQNKQPWLLIAWLEIEMSVDII